MTTPKMVLPAVTGAVSAVREAGVVEPGEPLGGAASPRSETAELGAGVGRVRPRKVPT